MKHFASKWSTIQCEQTVHKCEKTVHKCQECVRTQLLLPGVLIDQLFAPSRMIEDRITVPRVHVVVHLVQVVFACSELQSGQQLAAQRSWHTSMGE